MRCVYVATRSLQIGNRIYNGIEDGPIKGIETSAGFRVQLAQGLVAPMYQGPDGLLHQPAYAVTRTCKLGGRTLSVGDRVPDAQLLPTFRSLVATHMIVPVAPDAPTAEAPAAVPPDPPPAAVPPDLPRQGKFRTSWTR